MLVDVLFRACLFHTPPRKVTIQAGVNAEVGPGGVGYLSQAASQDLRGHLAMWAFGEVGWAFVKAAIPPASQEGSVWCMGIREMFINVYRDCPPWSAVNLTLEAVLLGLRNAHMARPTLYCNVHTWGLATVKMVPCGSKGGQFCDAAATVSDAANV